jgi:hypothetical protein
MRQTKNMRDDGCSCLFRVGSILARGRLRFYERCTVVVRNYAYVCERSCFAERGCMIDAVEVK